MFGYCATAACTVHVSSSKALGLRNPKSLDKVLHTKGFCRPINLDFESIVRKARMAEVLSILHDPSCKTVMHLLGVDSWPDY